MTQFKMNIDLELLKTQIDDLAEVKHTYLGPHHIYENLEGILNLLGTIRDQIEPPPPKIEWNNLVVCVKCGNEHFQRFPCLNCGGDGVCEECSDVDRKRLRKAEERIIPHFHNTGCPPGCDKI